MKFIFVVAPKGCKTFRGGNWTPKIILKEPCQERFGRLRGENWSDRSYWLRNTKKKGWTWSWWHERRFQLVHIDRIEFFEVENNEVDFKTCSFWLIGTRYWCIHMLVSKICFKQNYPYFRRWANLTLKYSSKQVETTNSCVCVYLKEHANLPFLP